MNLNISTIFRDVSFHSDHRDLKPEKLTGDSETNWERRCSASTISLQNDHKR